ncbi:rho-related GTP-binding protein RhoH [Paralichthys olivaceus]|uniref:rho-related GTP-binding protein RhoH n=1 Tax=Paralichthys olivaceus TaxID=8255 RepID=UPI00097DAABB|nr:PREDICTED: rho-related GTP-binding protein RhoH [Paralichthys olivaceus]
MNGPAEMSVKCVLVGDSGVGKTALLVRFTSETFPDTYKPTVFDNTGVEVYMDGVQISLGLWDTGGNDNFRQIRPRSYQQADVVLICYSVANPNSLANIQHKWIAEVRENLPRVPVLIVATQTDLRETGAHRGSCISAAEGRRMAHSVHAKGYLECSSLSNRGVQQVFEYAVRTAVNQVRKQTRRRMFDVNQCKVF